MKKNMIILIGAIAGMLLLSGCGTNTIGSLSPGDDQQAKQFKTNNSKANIYVYRLKDEVIGALTGSTLELDGKLVDVAYSGNYFYLQVKPGTHEIRTISNRMLDDGLLVLNTKAGKNYYVFQEMFLAPIHPGNRLKLVPENVGKENIKNSKLIKVVRQ